MAEMQTVQRSPEPRGFFDYFAASRELSTRVVIAFMLSTLSILMAMYFLMTAYFGAPVGILHRLIFLLFIMVFAFFTFPLGRKKWDDPLNGWFAVDVLLTLCALGVGFYFITDLDGWQMRFYQPSVGDTIGGTIAIILVLEATRRTVGMVMVCVAGFFLVHTRFADIFPGFLKTAPTPWWRMTDILFSDQGILSEPIQSMASYIILFLLFGGLLEKTGAGKYFIDLAYSIGGRYTAGPAKTAVLASALFGSISGSSVSNVVSTGCFTIPLMKSVGYTPTEAGAIEAVASTGGNYMPPIMGAVAFIMSQYLRVPYAYIIIYAIIPAMLYYLSLMAMVHFSGKKKNIKPLPKDQLPSFRKTLRGGGHLLLALVVLVAFLLYGYTAVMAAFWGIVVLFLLSFCKRDTLLMPRRLIAAFEQAARTSITVGMACACAGIIIGCMFSSGFGARMSSIIINAAAGRLWLALIYTMIISLILGCGMTSVGVYLILVTTIIPALTRMGVPPVAAHFFAFYFAVVSNITPPVCVAAFAGAAIAGASPMRTGVKAFELGLAAYAIPFMFVYNPALLTFGTPLEIINGIVSGTVGVVLLAAAVNGYLLRYASILERLLMLAAVPLLFMSSFATDAAGYLLFALVAFLQTRDIRYENVLMRRAGD